ncbi:MAG: hypothetical protein AB8G05_18630 [Oligoflexales bacterium]
MKYVLPIILVLVVSSCSTKRRARVNMSDSSSAATEEMLAEARAKALEAEARAAEAEARAAEAEARNDAEAESLKEEAEDLRKEADDLMASAGGMENENPPAEDPSEDDPQVSGPFKLDNSEQNKYLNYVEQYIDGQTRHAMHSDDPNAYTVRTYDVAEGDIFYAASDTYDNALASIFFTVVGKPQKAAKILDSWLRMHKWTLANDNYRKGLFWPRVNHYDLNPASWIDSGGAFLDVGNNSMMALAFCRYYLQFKDDAPNATLHKEYYSAAKAIMSEIHNNFQCKTGPYQGYMGRPTSTASADWQSVEHNLDMYALGACVQKAALTAEPGVNTSADEVQKIAGKFVSQMYDSANGRYRTGTEPSCNANTQLNNEFVPVDGITWRYLARAEENVANHDSRTPTTMEALVTPTFMIEDPGFTSRLGQAIWGVKFTNIGSGIQSENTGAALLALNDFHQNNASADIDKLRTSVKIMFDEYGSSGIPAHNQPSDDSCCNTGITWSYYFNPHTASTVYFGLALAYQFERNGQIIPGMNPYYPGSSKVPTQETVMEPQL